MAKNTSEDCLDISSNKTLNERNKIHILEYDEIRHDLRKSIEFIKYF